MPYPFAHPGAAVPLLRPLGRWGSLPALVVGSVAADLPRLAGLPLERSATHSLGGWLWFCIPAGVVATYFYQGFLRRPLTHLAPEGIRRRLPAPAWGRAAMGRLSFGPVVASVTLAAATHTLLDSVTHTYSPLVEGSSILQATLFTVSRWRLQLFNLLQHGGSLLLLGLLVWWVTRWYRRTEPASDPAVTPGPAIRGVVTAVLLGIPGATGWMAAWPRLSAGPSLDSLILGLTAGSQAAAPVVGPVLLGLALTWPVLERLGRPSARPGSSASQPWSPPLP